MRSIFWHIKNEAKRNKAQADVYQGELDNERKSVGSILTKTKYEATKSLNNVKQVTSKDGIALRKLDVKAKQKEQFENLLNEIDH